MPRRRPDRPVESVALKLVFSADEGVRAKIKESIPSATFRGRHCEVKIDGQRPGEVAEKARAILETLRTSA